MILDMNHQIVKFHLVEKLLLLFHTEMMVQTVSNQLLESRIYNRINHEKGIKWFQMNLVRFNQLKTLLYHMVPILMRQNIKFKFFTITQNQNVTFNRAKERFYPDQWPKPISIAPRVNGPDLKWKFLINAASRIQKPVKAFECRVPRSFKVKRI